MTRYTQKPLREAERERDLMSIAGMPPYVSIFFSIMIVFLLLLVVMHRRGLPVSNDATPGCQEILMIRS